jgi:hypothetical protein
MKRGDLTSDDAETFAPRYECYSLLVDMIMRRWAWFAVIAAVVGGACSSPLGGTGGTGGAGAGGGGTGGAADAGSAPSVALIGQPCTTDATCGNPFLTCIKNECLVRYQQPCTVDSDCGPAGFACTPACADAGPSCVCPAGTNCNQCVMTGPTPTCTSDDQCLTGWSCYDLCNTGIPANRRCDPPFLISLCVN